MLRDDSQSRRRVKTENTSSQSTVRPYYACTQRGNKRRDRAYESQSGRTNQMSGQITTVQHLQSLACGDEVPSNVDGREKAWCLHPVKAQPETAYETTHE